MAEEVPISDVLCNAMEYLCKLGSNLRTRSENLMDKRISKDKLRNVHAVRKASSKVLLICELSRKSLENVENSVKRVLTLVDASHCSPPVVGAKNKYISSRECFYIEYDSCKLRISEKIFLKHYTSVKVHAKQMPTSMMDKYPVYYNCSLYRNRKQEIDNSSKNIAPDEQKQEGYDNEINVNTNSEESDINSKEIPSETEAASEQLKIESSSKENGEKNKMGANYNSDESAKSDKGKVNKCAKLTKSKKKIKNVFEDSDNNSKDTNEHKIQDENDAEEVSSMKFALDAERNAKATKKILKVLDELGSSDVQDKNGQKTCVNSDSENENISSQQQAESESSKSVISKCSKRSSRLSEEAESSVVSKDTSKKSQHSKKAKSTRFPDSDTDSSEKYKTGNKMRAGYYSDESDKSDKGKVNKCAKLTKSKKKIINAFEDSDDNSKDTIEQQIQDENDAEEVSSKKFALDAEKNAKASKKILKVLDELGSSDVQDKNGQKTCVNSDSENENISSQQQAESESSKSVISKCSKRSSRLSEEAESSVVSKDTSKKSQHSKKAKSTRFPDSDTDSSEKYKTGNKMRAGYYSDESDKSDKGKVNKCAKLTKSKKKIINAFEDSDDNSKDTIEQQIQDENDAEEVSSKKFALDAEKNAKASKLNVSKVMDELGSNDVQDKNSQETCVNGDSENENVSFQQQVESERAKPVISKCSKRSSRLSEEAESSVISKETSKKSQHSKKAKSTRFPDSDSDSSEKHKTGNESKRRKLDKETDKKSDPEVVDLLTPVKTQDSKEIPKNKKEKNEESHDIDKESDSKANNIEEPEVVDLLTPIKSQDSKLSEKDSNEDSDSNPDKKPRLKLVSLTKLLKPDVLKKEMCNVDKINKYKTNSCTTKSSRNEISYQEKMRQQVSAFKAKKFDVVVTRLPKFSDNFLSQHGLKRITQNGSEVYSFNSQVNTNVHEKLNVSAVKNNFNKSKSKEKKIFEKTNLSDDSDKNIKEVVGKAKLSLLNSDSDDLDLPDKNESKDEKRSKQSDSEKSKGKQKCKGPDKCRGKKESEEKLVSNNDIIEEVSLDSLDSPKTPENKRTETEKTTPQSRRKEMMENMAAKKMLLTYSSSSDTEDEQLRNTMKDIKSALLKNSSSEDELDIKKLPKNSGTSSDSEISFKITRKSKRAKLDDSDEKEQEESSISQMDGTNDELSNSGSSSQMGRSKQKVTSSHRKQNTENGDTNESEINRLTNLKTITTRSRRRPGDKSTSKAPRMPKAPPIKEDILPPGSSGSGSESEHEQDEVEELPPVPIESLNGDNLDMNCMAREDLLATSENSSSENEKTNNSDDDKKNEESDEDNVKSTRRKANAITSDSEAELARRKADKVSDFEDSEDSSEPRKSKRKKKVSDSDSSLSSSDTGKKKRKRIKQVNDSDGSGSDSETEGKNKHGRKNIRKVMSKDQLEEATKKAARQEKERIARIAERQKLYNNLEFDESGKPDEVVLDKVVLDFDPETKDPIIEVDRGLVKKLKPHQANGIKFMWNACFESVKRIKKDRGSGCILAHCMGLGKTLQVVSLTHTLLTHSDLTKVKRVLVVCPLSTVLNWVNEFTMWLKHAETEHEVDVFELSRHKQNSERSWQLQQWVECGGVCVLGYEMFRNLSADNNKKFKKKMLKTFQEALVDPGPDLVVCDEGHLLKNEKTSLSQSMNRVRTLRRIVLTGTPLQNNLKEYYCMVQFVKPNLLGKYNEYLNRFVNPITNGQYTDSTERDISLMKRRSHVLHTMLDGAVQRRDYGVLAPFLPPKHEYVLFITLTDIQVKLYQHYLDNYSRRPLPGKSSGFLFPDFQSLQRIWTHPLVLKYNSERYEIMQQKKRDKEEEDSEGSLADFIDDDSTPDESSTEESSDDLSDASDDSRKKNKKKGKAKKGKGKDAKPRRGTRANPVELAEDEKPITELEEIKYENPTEWWMKLVTEEELEDIRHSHKLLLLFDILRQCDAIGDKLLVFSQSLYSLDLIEHFLGKVDEATQEGRIDEKLAGHVGSWSPGVDYFRLDGSTSCENRSIWCKNFNREDNPRARLFLISTRAGGLGINLVAANRVVIFDVSWNPSHDVQSIFRVYRFGQKKPCYVYRFLAMGTMEEKIYERQVTKQAISKRVIDEQQIDRHYAANDLAELYKFEPVPVEPRPVPKLPKDRLFAEMLKDHEKQIFRFHEHDSLLENKEEETLSEEERKKAWEEFENEKKAPPPSPFPNSWSMHNGMAASLLQQQQQQLAYAALAAMIRKDMPNINDNQIRDMLPIICNANPGMFGGYDYGLMQKMSEIYKYAQPGMMNPSMMNPVMNHAAGGGMSTSSSLQYEPPWQRQQQQQQQMRLQQLMQQQQNMGAKYYAGGLGSRDPVAMALQQQRAREFLGAGGAAGAVGGAVAGGTRPAPPARPRGRPPLQPRAPHAAQDVVNLDSD